MNTLSQTFKYNKPKSVEAANKHLSNYKQNKYQLN